MLEPTDEIAVVDAARAQAEARRKRILDKANKRLGVVSGEQAQADEEKEASASKAARIRAARQRRYGKKSVDPAADVSKEEDETGANVELDEELNDPSTANILPIAQENLDQEIEAKDSKLGTLQQEVPGSEDETQTEPSAHAVDEPKKKYLGVARMRRHMMKKKKLDDDVSEDVHETNSSPTSGLTHVDPKLISPDPLKVRTIPIYMHILTILLLFFAGVDISFQRSRSLLVHSKLAIHEFGIPLVHRSLGSPGGVKKAPSSQFDTLEHGLFGADAGHFLDEFQDEVIEHLSENNIDPLFRVDLDKLTKGPGLMKQLARGAVFVHRSILWLVYFLPLSILQSMLSIPQALFRSPPTLCLVALVLRHVVGKGILGAGIPESTKDSDKSNSIDVIAMAKNFATNFLTTNFPTAVILYEAFTHLRADMYVLLSGVFSGLVWIHLLASASSQDGVSEMGPTDEL